MSSVDREARLVPTLINVLIAGMCDPSRLKRGRDYARQGAVMDVHAEPGTLTGFVQGSRSAPYEVEVHVTPAPSFESLTALVPTARDIRFDCSCPDWDAPCKHAVAVMAAFAERIGSDPHLLAAWRGFPERSSSVRSAVVGSRTHRPAATATAPTDVPDEVRSQVDTYLGMRVDVSTDGGDLGTTDRPASRTEPWTVPDLVELPPPRADGWDDPWASMLEDAIRHLAEH